MQCMLVAVSVSASNAVVVDILSASNATLAVRSYRSQNGLYPTAYPFPFSKFHFIITIRSHMCTYIPLVNIISKSCGVLILYIFIYYI